jgi:tetratricopeptide (TPR) repeat protein
MSSPRNKPPSKTASGCLRHIDTLARMCDDIIAMRTAYADVREQLHTRAWQCAGRGGVHEVVAVLDGVVSFLSGIEDKNEEITEDLADLCILIGSIYNEAHACHEAIEWLYTAIAVNDRLAEPYRLLADCFAAIGEYDKAVRCREQEIALDPGNYFSYLQLAALHERNGDLDRAVDELNRLIERDPENTQALHRLIVIYKQRKWTAQFLQNRLVRSGRVHTSTELVIWTLHAFELKGPQKLLERINKGQGHFAHADVYVCCLLQAFMLCSCGETHKADETLSQCVLPRNANTHAALPGVLRTFGTVFTGPHAERLIVRARQAWGIDTE